MAFKWRNPQTRTRLETASRWLTLLLFVLRVSQLEAKRLSIRAVSVVHELVHVVNWCRLKSGIFTKDPSDAMQNPKLWLLTA